MSSPLPIPSKAAIRALRSIALGTSCVIGVIVEDRRRRISTLKTAVANKKKLQSSRRYHNGSSQELLGQLSEAAVHEHSLQWYEKREYGPGRHHGAETTHRTASESATVVDSEVEHSAGEGNDLKSIQRAQPSASQSLPSAPAASQHGPPITKRQIQSALAIDSPSITRIYKAIEPYQPTLVTGSNQSQESLIDSINDLLGSKDERKLDRAVKLFTSGCPPIPSRSALHRWLELSVRISNECRASGRWEDASRILTLVFSLGPIDESQYLAYDAFSIAEYHLQRDSDIPPSAAHINSAADLFLARLTATPRTRGIRMEQVGRSLLVESLSSRLFHLPQSVFWRTLCWAENPVEFVRWAIDTFSQHSDHKTVVRIFLLFYSRMAPPMEQFNQTMDHVVDSVLAMKGSNASDIVEAFARMDCPGTGKLRSRWVMRLLQAHWARHQSLAQTIELFEKAVSLGILNKISHPQGVYRSLVEMAVKAGDEEVAYMYADQLIRDYPDMENDIALKLAVFKAKAGDWDNVLQVFRQVRPSELPDPALYTDAFILVLKVFADVHSATATQDFAMLFMRDMGIQPHSHMVSLIATMYGKQRDMKGLVAWLGFCRQEGFALDAGLCNTVLHHCWATWKLALPELQAMHSHFMALNPHYSDEITQRILNQAASFSGKKYLPTGQNTKAVAVHKAFAINKFAYTGRSMDPRAVFDAMNQELTHNNPSSAVMIYKRAKRFGMPFHGHCFRLNILAILRAKGYNPGFALSQLQAAHAEGHDIEAAVSTFTRQVIDAFVGNPQDVLMHMRNILGHLESSQIPISPTVLTHMANVCVRVGHHERAIILCNLAQDRSAASHPFLSKQSYRALASAYSELLDIAGMKSLVDHLSASPFATDKVLLSHFKSIRRLVRKKEPSDSKTAILDMLDRVILEVVNARAEVRTEGKELSREAMRIMSDVVPAPTSKHDSEWRQWDPSTKQLIAALKE